MTIFIETENNQPSLEEVVEILDDADSLYAENKTLLTAVTRLGTYVTNICYASFDGRVPLFIRFIKIFTEDDWESQSILTNKPNFRAVLKITVTEIENAYFESVLPEIPELMEQMEQVKHIIGEIENPYTEGEETVEHSEDSENEYISSLGLLDDTSEDEV
jgi:hypothetical protein